MLITVKSAPPLPTPRASQTAVTNDTRSECNRVTSTSARNQYNKVILFNINLQYKLQVTRDGEFELAMPRFHYGLITFGTLTSHNNYANCSHG